MTVIVQFTIEVTERESPMKASEEALAILYTKGSAATITAFDPSKIPFRYQAAYPGHRKEG